MYDTHTVGKISIMTSPGMVDFGTKSSAGGRLVVSLIYVPKRNQYLFVNEQGSLLASPELRVVVCAAYCVALAAKKRCSY